MENRGDAQDRRCSKSVMVRRGSREGMAGRRKGEEEIRGGLQRVGERDRLGEGKQREESGQKNGRRPSCQWLADTQVSATQPLRGP